MLRTALTIFLVSMGLFGATSRAASDVDFQRDVQPILAEHCLHCHGVDAAERKAGLRLDLREDAVRGGESGTPAIVPGKPQNSELIQRVLSADADLVMPPPDQNKPLSKSQQDILAQWISEGAKFEAHWSFVPPRKAPLPSVEIANPIDSFVTDHLKRRGLQMSPMAESSTLARRLYLDLIGLPPTPEELRQFQSDGFATTVQQLLNSERFGEKWARHWLDLARYSDTNGYEKDLQREQWAWRDWVINSINRDIPWNTFLLEQIAGDLLPNATQDQIIATGFLRNSMINEEGAIVPEQFRMVEMFDRIDCVGKSVLGLSTQCAQCHTHKFDPITHHEYYGMFAFLNNTYEAQSWVYTDEQLKQREELHGQIAQVEERIRTERPNWKQELQEWARSINAQNAVWIPLEATELGTISGLNHPTQEHDKSLLMKGHSSADVFMISVPRIDGVTGLRLETLPHRDLPHGGPGRSRTGTWAINELEVFTKAPGSTEWNKQKLLNATADFSEAEVKSADGKKSTGPVSFLIDGSDDTTWRADRGAEIRNQAGVAVVQFETPQNLADGTELKIAWRMGDMVGCARFSVTTSAAPAASPADHAAVLALQVPEDQRTVEQEKALFTAWRHSVAELKSQNDEIAKLHQSMPVAATSILHVAEREPENHRTTFLLDRGNWDQPLEAVEPHVPAAFHSFPEHAPRNRLGFAQWLTDERSPLTARVAVNQVWQAIFGTGLVETSDDLGTRSAMPEYGELLDWLAVDLMEHGWSRKHLIRTIVSSQTYQQSSRVSPDLLTNDPRNQLLARAPRFRADAEVIRDVALTASGLIHHKIGGPGVIPPVPQNVLDYNYVYPSYWTPATGAERYRRAVYGFRKRSMPDPVMSNLDGPNGDLPCARRIRSNTPLAALTVLNEPIFVEAARALALRVLKEGGSTDESRADYAFVLCTSRPPSSEERNELLALLQTRRQRLAEGWLNPREVVTGDPAKLPELTQGTTPQDAAAWTLVCRVLLNLDETISRN
jgi:hypothetical protein